MRAALQSEVSDFLALIVLIAFVSMIFVWAPVLIVELAR